jgi:glycosyltransferase involved in cell wall biosynthesis
MIKLSILICTIPKRKAFFDRLMAILEPQENDFTEVIYNNNEFESIGKKRNDLLKSATGEYVCFIDDDDRVSDDYIKMLFEGIEKGVDCCSLTGEITFDGKKPKPFIHSMEYDRYFEDDKAYYRYPNHLNCIKASIAKQFRFPEKNHGEDTDFATFIHNAKVLKTEHWIPGTIYYYDYISNK